MQLLNPAGLFLLGLIPILILIHSLKPRPKQVEVTNLFLWMEAMDAKGGGLRLRRFMTNLPLLLQILAVVLASSALARPVFPTESRPQGNIILVMDVSASMKARLENGSRFDRAVKEAIKAVDDLPDDKKMLIIEAGLKPVIRSDFSSDKNRLKEVLKTMEASDTPAKLQDAVFLALSFVKPEQDDTVLLISDGSGREFAASAALHPRIKPVVTGEGGKNLAITRFEIRPAPRSEDSLEIMLEVKNYNDHPALCPISLTLAQVPVVQETIGLKAMEKKTRFYTYSGELYGTARASITLKDDFPTDNNVFAVLRPSEPVWVFLVTQGNYFLETLLASYPNVRVNSAREIISSSWADQAGRHDIVILDRIAPPSIPKGNYILIGAFPPSLPIATAGRIKAPRVLTWNRSDPLMNHVDLTGLAVEQAHKIEADAAARPLVESRDTGLIYVYHDNGLKTVTFGFDLTRTDLPLRAAFPVMMTNILSWFEPRSFRFQAQQVKAGETVPVYTRVETREFTIETPSGRKESLKAVSRPVEYSGTGEVGLYTVFEGRERRYFAVNLVDEDESDIRVPGIDERTGQGAPVAMVRAEMPLWRLFLFTVLIILFLEWRVWLKNG